MFIGYLTTPDVPASRPRLHHGPSGYVPTPSTRALYPRLRTYRQAGPTLGEIAQTHRTRVREVASNPGMEGMGDQTSGWLLIARPSTGEFGAIYHLPPQTTHLLELLQSVPAMPPNVRRFVREPAANALLPSGSTYSHHQHGPAKVRQCTFTASTANSALMLGARTGFDVATILFLGRLVCPVTR